MSLILTLHDDVSVSGYSTLGVGGSANVHSAVCKSSLRDIQDTAVISCLLNATCICQKVMFNNHGIAIFNVTSNR